MSDSREMKRKRLAALMYPWGSDFSYGHGSGSLGAVASYYDSGKVYPDEAIVESALRQVEKDLPLAEHGLHGWGPKEVKELHRISRSLKYFLKTDYPSREKATSHSRTR